MLLKLSRHRTGGLLVLQAQLHPRGSFHAQQARGIVQVHQHQGAVEFVVARFEQARHPHRLEPGHHTRRGDLAPRCDEGQGRPFRHAELACDLHAQQHLPLAWRQARNQLRLAARQFGDLAFVRRVDPAQHHAAHFLAARQQDL